MSEEKAWEENNFVNIDVTAAWYIEAVNKAKKQLDKFIEVFNNAPAEKYNFHIKVKLTEGDNIEHLWLIPSSYSNYSFLANVDNTPFKLKNIHFKDMISVSAESVEDWIIYEPQKKIWGNFIARAFKAQNK